MVIEKGANVQDAEILSVSDLIPAPTTPTAASPGEGMENVERYLQMMDKGISLADRGVTMFGKAEGIIKNLSEVAHHRMATQQQQPPQQQVIMQQPPPQEPIQQPPPQPARIPISIQGKQAMMTPGEISQLIEQMQQPPATAEQISGVLGFLLGQKEDMSVEELKTLIDRNPQEVTRLIAFSSGGIK